VKVLIVGASGFIGARLARAFSRDHEVTCASRSRATLPAECSNHLHLDYSALPVHEELTRAVAGHEVVINAVGILRERGAQRFAALHAAGPRALFAACAAAGVRRVLQISALGACAQAVSPYHRSKHEADGFLMTLPLDWAVIQPSLVYGPGGSSARMFDRLAALPWTPLPAGGHQRVQPVHVDDLVTIVLALAESREPLRCVLPAVGPRALSLREFLAELRGALGRRPAPAIPVPGAIMRVAARVGDLLPRAKLDTDTLGMLERGNVASAAPAAQWLGHPPRPVAAFIAPEEREARWGAATLSWWLTLARLGVAFMWLIAAIVSAGPYPIAASLQLLRDIGSPATLAPLLLAGAIGLDLIFGVLTLLPRRARWLWPAQIAVVAGYTAIITWRLPALWLEPFGPVAKNIPILILLILLWQLEKRR
jgi:uncharacterized protein YbjT (DUF2867 family)